MSGDSILKGWIDPLLRKQTVHKFYNRVPDNRVDRGRTAKVFEPHKGYFQVRLAEMFLKDQREYWRDFIPLGIVLSEFDYDGETKTVPFFVGNQLLQAIEKKVDGENVEYLNTRVAGPIPYIGGEVHLFVGLFRTQVDDLAANLFNMVETIVKTFDISILSPYLNIARSLGEGLTRLLNLKAVEFRLGTWDEFKVQSDDPHRFQEGYLVYVNCPENNVNLDHLWVEDGRLYEGERRDSKERFRRHDYCLVRIEYLPIRTDHTKLPFHKLFEEARKKILGGEEADAKSAFLELTRQVAVSPDLTEENKELLMENYLVNYGKAVSLYEKMPGARAKDEQRGIPSPRDSGTLDGRESIQRIVNWSDRAAIPQDIATGLREVSVSWNEIPELKGQKEDFQLTDDVLNRQMEFLGKIRGDRKPNPKALANAITVATLRRG
jgi:hypothetical protein